MLDLEEGELSPVVDFGLNVPPEALKAVAEKSRTQPQGATGELHYRREGRLLALKGRRGERRLLQRTALLLFLGDGLALGLLALLGRALGNWALAPFWEEKRRQAGLAAEASHELKTPLTVILANVGLLLAQPEGLGEKGRSRAHAIQAEGLRMARLVADLLSLTQMEAEEAAWERLDFGQLVQGVLLSFEAVAFERGLELKGEIASSLFLRGDRGRLTQLVEILLDNACKYAPPGTAVELVLAGRGKRLVLQVKNQGEPIPPEEMGKLFRRFYRAAGQDGEGAGLGLFLAQRIAALHGGRLVAQSDGEGTVFAAELPAERGLEARNSR